MLPRHRRRSSTESLSKFNHIKCLECMSCIWHPLHMLKLFVLQPLTLLTSLVEICWIRSYLFHLPPISFSLLWSLWSCVLFLRSGVEGWIWICWKHRHNLNKNTGDTKSTVGIRNSDASSASRKPQSFSFFLSVQRPNNRFENTYVFYLPLFNSVTKNIFLEDI
jgi:hypothetical protein